MYNLYILFILCYTGPPLVRVLRLKGSPCLNINYYYYYYFRVKAYNGRVSRNLRPKSWKPKIRKPKTWKPKWWLSVSLLMGCLSEIKGEVSRKFQCRHFKTQKCLSVSRNKEIIVKFVINYHPSAKKLSISASGQRQSRPIGIET